jgi:protein tyrosine phosphatase (PTP) superfamily phosphohydrolase (DUF442 family)
MKWQHPVLPGACQPLEGVIACGLPTEQELREAHQGGLRTVINLCPVAEQKIDEQALITGLGMRYVHLPIAGPADLTRANAMRLAELLADPTARPLMVHCASGNRVGALFALKAFFADGTDRDTALAAGRTTGLKALEGAVSGIINREAVHQGGSIASTTAAACTATTVDRVVLRFAGVFILASLALTQMHSPNWLWFTAFVGANMLQASFTGFCPLARILAWFGIPYGAAFGGVHAKR